ncbi:cation diffusion facilitator family transporter [Paracoccus spongiarum]|uniref:Cation diffusion facilitator family transporter n=1 Tax=Paracoccus spongiarum TaxID=3064387 RepID=A0ABT9JAZ0_9RHOB|nr:cation diffusion facilitator family transporter [Paracoccus sp. 2205BS29-5]MDP5306844.1 cation diffusion facilitator family transporter [Paracoccus sp. 2205BS29-5]
MGHDHHGPSHRGPSHHGHHHSVPGGDGAIGWAVAINLALTAAQIGGGLIADSTALIADGIHNLSDAMALVLAFGARRLARRAASPDFSYGWGRAEIVAAFVNYLALIAVSLWLAIEAIGRLADLPQVAGELVMALAGLALVIDLATAALVWRLSRSSVNIRAAFLHNLADAGVSVAVICGGALIWAFGWNLADPVLTLAISAVIVTHVVAELGPVLRMLMLAAPRDSDPAAVVASLRGLQGVADVHHLHLWQIDEHRLAASLHLVIADGDFAEITRRAKDRLREDFGIAHATIEVEPPDACADRAGV